MALQMGFLVIFVIITLAFSTVASLDHATIMCHLEYGICWIIILKQYWSFSIYPCLA